MNHKRPTQPGPSTLSVHAGESRQKHANSITDPIFAASTYTFADSQSVIDYIEQKLPREEYGRYGNPGEASGVIGTVGPTRMDYTRAISSVRYLATFLGELLAALDDDRP